MAPYLNMILKADINRIYDEKYLEAEQAKKEKFFNAPKKNSANSTGKNRTNKSYWKTWKCRTNKIFKNYILNNIKKEAKYYD